MISPQPNSYGVRLREFNSCHEPAGSETGGQFCSGDKAETAAPASKRPKPNADVQRVAAAYTRAHGMVDVDHSSYVDVDQGRAGRIADVYDALPVDDTANPKVARAYAALGREIQAQWDHANAAGVRFEPWSKDGQPYQTSIEMAEDVRQNKHLYFYQGGDPHPLLNRIDAKTGLSQNDMFRAIHDYFGHAAGGYGFGPRGEENAWRVHSQMFSDDARRAMTTETRGQNSWVNFGRHNYDEQGNYKNVPVTERPYAVQKVALLPDGFVFGPRKPKRKLRESTKPFTRKPATLREDDELPYRRPPQKKGQP